MTLPKIQENESKLDLYFKVLDYWILVPILTISIIGLYVLNIVLSSGYEGNGATMFTKQAGAVLVGVLIAFILCLIETPTMKLIAFAVYGVSVLLLVYVLVDKFSMVATTGADSWLKIPVIGTFQPSELAKVGIVMLSSYYFADIKAGKGSKWKNLLIIAIIYGIPLLLIYKQPDLGTLIVIVFIFCCMIFAYGIPYRAIFLALSMGIVALPVVWTFYLKEYQKNRILTLLYPGFDPEQAYHIEQAKLAISSGGLTGSGLDTAIAVPVKESDFIYTAVAERLGFIGAFILIILILIFIIRCFYVASKVREDHSCYMVTGIAAMFTFHYIENLGMCVGIMPITGIPLSFVSLGGTSMIVNYFALGIILCISMERNMIKRIKSYDYHG
jgi:rod shape determining protein RodA